MIVSTPNLGIGNDDNFMKFPSSEKEQDMFSPKISKHPPS